MIISYNYVHIYVGAIIEGPKNTTYFPGQGNIILTCNVTAGVPLWMVNGTTFTLRELSVGELPGHNRIGANIVIETPVNNTEYVCESLITTDNTIRSKAALVYVAGKLNKEIDINKNIATFIHMYFKSLISELLTEYIMCMHT